MPSARIWRCARQNFAGSAASSALPPRVLQEGVDALFPASARLNFNDIPLIVVQMRISLLFKILSNCALQPVDLDHSLF